jgi:beta-phosphoglucomutase-like phosphatase (HAD superfamily)
MINSIKKKEEKVMEIYTKDFSAQATELVKGGNDLNDLITLRLEKLQLTAEHKEVNDKIEDLLKKLENLPGAKEIVRELEDEITWLECASHSAAYRDGITDLMTALTFNKLNITSVEFYKVS